MTTAEPRQRPRLPGAEGLWVFIGFDAMIFALLFGSFLSARRNEPELFEASRQTLNADLGGLDTLILLTSSWLVALGVQAARRGRPERAARLLLGGVLTGLAFALSKSVEYADKVAGGVTPATDGFYTWYFLLTGLHLAHVVAGTLLLTWVWRRTRAHRVDRRDQVVLESVATFWHLVDLLWIVIFPLLYLQR